MLLRYLMLTFIIATQFSCGVESAKFAGGIKFAGSQTSDAIGKIPDPLALSTYTYGLAVAEGAPVLPQGKSPAVPKIKFGENGIVLSDAELAGWSVSIHIVGSEAPAHGPVNAYDLDLTNAVGMVTAQADFKEVQGHRQGTAFASFFVDGEKPHAVLTRIENTADSKGSRIYWSANDNYRINRANTVLIACRSLVEEFSPKVSADLDKLPAGCAVLHKGEDLFAQPSMMTLGAVTVGDTKFDGASIVYGLYTEDAVGISDFTWIEEPTQKLAQLELSTAPATVVYTSQNASTVSITLQSIRDGNTVAIHSEAGEWSKYKLSAVTANANGGGTVTGFNASLAVPLGRVDGLYSFAVQAEEIATQIKSNKKDVLIVRDTVDPVVSGIQISVLEGILTPTSTVTINWSATDANKISSQSLSIRQTGSDVFTPLATLAGGQTSHSFTWGDRPAKGFEIQIKAVDPAGNIGMGTSPKWTPQVFNAALLTSSVDCLFCHITVYGDLGGINFSATPHGDTGSFFTVTSKVYGTNAVPAKLAATARAGAQSNYNNSPLIMFPKNGQWPTLTADILKPRMNGTLKVGNIMVIRSHEGNLILDGSKSGDPIVVNGEVLIKGDVIIKGTYRGIGTIYANNIYIVDDLVAMKSPFPFDEDPSKAVVQAVSAIGRKDDALYLGSLNQVLIGSYTESMGTACGPNGANIKCVNANPFGWLANNDVPKAKSVFVSLGRRANLLKDVNGVARELVGQHFSPTPDINGVVNERFQMEVNRVDAFIYAQNNLQWRAYSNILLNGGYMAPYSGITSTAPYRVTLNAENAAINWAPNPRNGLPVNRNVIRYDYRLRVGGAGFETIKSYFDQN